MYGIYTKFICLRWSRKQSSQCRQIWHAVFGREFRSYSFRWRLPSSALSLSSCLSETRTPEHPAAGSCKDPATWLKLPRRALDKAQVWSLQVKQQSPVLQHLCPSKASIEPVSQQIDTNRQVPLVEEGSPSRKSRPVRENGDYDVLCAAQRTDAKQSEPSRARRSEEQCVAEQYST